MVFGGILIAASIKHNQRHENVSNVKLPMREADVTARLRVVKSISNALGEAARA